MSLIRIVVDTAETAGTVDAQLNLNGNPADAAQDFTNVVRWLEGRAAGLNTGCKLQISTNAVQASATGTFTGDPTAAETVTVNGVVFTARASGAVANEYNFVAGNVSATAAALAAAINASTSAKIAGTVQATSALGVVTFQAITPGTAGNLFTLTEATSNFTVTGAVLSGGTEGTMKTINRGR